MLDALRKSAGGFVAKIFIGLLVLSFGIWGIADIFTGFRQDTLATVGEAEVTAQEFQTAYSREVQNFSQRIGQPLSRSQAANLGIPSQVLGRLVAEAAFDHVAQTLQVGISGGQLVREIQDNPAFRGPDGRFDRNRLNQVLYANQLTEDEYVEESRQLARRRQVAEALAGGIQPPEALLQAAHSFQAEERVVRYVKLTAEALASVPEPSAEELDTYFEANKANYGAPEYRQLKLLLLDPAAIARPEEVSADEARDAYDRNTGRFGAPERRRVMQLTYNDQAEAEAAAAKLASGTSFEQLMEERGLSQSDVDLGLMTREQMIDPAVAEAAFGLDAGEASGVVEGRFGPRIIKVETVEPAATQAYEEVEETIRQEIATRKAENDVLSLHDEIEDARAGGATLSEIAERFSLSVRTIEAIARDGTAPSGERVELPDASNLLSEAFASDIGDEAPPVQVGSRGFLWYDVAEITPPRDRALDEVRDRVVADWKADQLGQRLDMRAEELASKLRDGADFATLAEAAELELQTSEPLTRQGGSEELSGQATNEAFGGPVGHVGTANGADDSRIVLQVMSVGTPAYFAESQDTQQLSAELAGMLQTSLINQFVSGVQNSIGVSVNQNALANAIGVSDGS